jgi:DNA-binding IclR family transcriptional regulator
VPVFDSSGKVIAALSVSSASSVLVAERYTEVIGILKDKAKLISEHLGYQSVLCNVGNP